MFTGTVLVFDTCMHHYGDLENHRLVSWWGLPQVS